MAATPSNFNEINQSQISAVKPRIRWGKIQPHLKLQCNQHSTIETFVTLPPIAHNTPPTTPVLALSLSTNDVIHASTPQPLDLTVTHQSEHHTPPSTPMDVNTVNHQTSKIAGQSRRVTSPVLRKSKQFAHSDIEMSPSTSIDMNTNIPNVYSLPTKPMYNTPLLSHMIQQEKLLHKQFLEKRITDIPMKRTYSREKVRQVCSQSESFDLNNISQSDLQKRAQLRSINNQKSLQSRLKQKMSRVTDSLTVLYLRERIAEYERRIEKLVMVYMNPHAPIEP